MILYTIVPTEEIFTEPDPPQTFEVVRGEMRLLVSAAGGARATVVRVISSNPNDYLNPTLQPGEVIPLDAGDIAPEQAQEGETE